MTKQWYEKRGEELTEDLRRVADALEEILRLVKKDQETADAYRRQQND
jgi:hypothetical protein